MTTYISIADDITDETLRKIEDAKGDVVVVHAICRTIMGRRKLARILKRKGCRTEVVHRLGWATSSPAVRARSKPCSLSPSAQPLPPPPQPVLMVDTHEESPSAAAPTETSKLSRRKRKRTTPSDS